MPVEPPVKRALAFIDGQNLFHNVRKVFSYNMGHLQVLRQVSIPGSSFPTQAVDFGDQKLLGW
jgi:hypothetical protein